MLEDTELLFNLGDETFCLENNLFFFFFFEVIIAQFEINRNINSRTIVELFFNKGRRFQIICISITSHRFYHLVIIIFISIYDIRLEYLECVIKLYHSKCMLKSEIYILIIKISRTTNTQVYKDNLFYLPLISRTSNTLLRTCILPRSLLRNEVNRAVFLGDPIERCNGCISVFDHT